ncbi:Ig-like domain-containing protein [Vibrio gigantis]|uniref:PKD domain-containing protein n=1 Tax=Vibrio gigantis TaxID=296199 RepID=UPI0035A5D2A6
MTSKLKWTLLAAAMPALIACGSGSSDTSSDSSNNATVEKSYAKLGKRVRLDATQGLDTYNENTTFEWKLTSKPDGSNVALNANKAIAPYFTPDVVGDYTFELESAISGTSNTTKQTIEVTDASQNVAPIIDIATPPSVSLTKSIKIPSNAVDLDGDVLTYQWALLSTPDNATMKLTGSGTSTAVLLSNTAGDYKLKLTVSDGYESVSQEVTVSYSAENVAPVANAGGVKSLEIREAATLDGSGSYDGNEDAITYTWKLLSKPENSTAELSDSAVAKPDFTPDQVGDYLFSLTVNDGEFTSEADMVRLSASAAGSSEIIFTFGDEKTVHALPYTPTPITLDKTIIGDVPEYVEVATYTLEAVGKDYTISEITEMDFRGEDYAPKMTGIELNQVLHSGDVAYVKMWAKPTTGTRTNVIYSFILDSDFTKYMGVAYDLSAEAN